LRFRPDDPSLRSKCGADKRSAPKLSVAIPARAIVLTNQKVAILELSGQQVGLMANVDRSRLAITLK
jgi:hypothetical protein